MTTNKTTKATKVNGQYLKDGYLVVGLVRHRGCTTYEQEDKEQTITGEMLDANWKTFKKCQSVNEEKKMGEVNYALNKRIFALGVRVANFGTIVPLERQDELNAALKDIEVEVDKYNAEAKYTKLYAELSVFVISGGDERLAKVMYGRIVESLNEVMESIGRGDIKGMREALASLNGVDEILPLREGEKLNEGIEKARRAAREAVKATKEIALDEERTKVAAKMLSELGVAGLRATFVEMASKIEKGLDKDNRLPLTDARQIE